MDVEWPGPTPFDPAVYEEFEARMDARPDLSRRLAEGDQTALAEMIEVARQAKVAVTEHNDD